MTDDDIDLFRQAVSGAKRLRAEVRAADNRRKPKPRARFAAAEREQVMRESLAPGGDHSQLDHADNLFYRRPSVAQRTMRKLARGRFSVQAEIDLHGMTVAEAKPRLADFLQHSARHGRLCVRIIHGKGLGSGHRGPVLKMSVSRWLRQWDVVLAFVSARQADGGTGAVYVLLRQS